MKPLPTDSPDDALIAFVDEWASLMEAEDYEAAFACIGHNAKMGWTPDLLREVVKAYGDQEENQKVTLAGEQTDIRQQKEVTRFGSNRSNFMGEIWYGLNINGFASDLTATFDLRAADEGIAVQLNDIHVM